MTTDEMIALSAVDAVAAMRNGRFTALAYAKAVLARCADAADLNAFITLDRALGGGAGGRCGPGGWRYPRAAPRPADAGKGQRRHR